MIKKLRKVMFMGTLLIGLVLGLGQPVFAQSNESEEVVEKTEGEPFTPDGNAQLVDEATDKDGKIFYTFTTKNNEYFYLVIDKDRDTENVYMLNLIDEQDLMALIDEQEETGSFSWNNKDNEINLKPEAEETAEETDDPEPVEQPERKNNGGIILLFCVLVGGVAVAVAYYLKFVRGKESDFEEEDMDFDDDDEEYCTDEEDTVELMDTEDSIN